MNQEERLNYLINYLCEDTVLYKDMEVEKEEKHAILRSLMNIRMPKPVSNEFLRIQDDFLIQESIEKGIVAGSELPTINDKYGFTNEYSDIISLWQGDITRLKVDAIINAANSSMLGCFVPCHKCIDNAIHSAAGIELREECYLYMEKQKRINQYYEEPTGRAVVTSAYNLPCNYVIHTVGPIVRDYLTESHREELKSCYESCMQAAIDNGIRTIAFCCISTGEYRFPNEEAAKIAYEAIKNFLTIHRQNFDRIIFNVYKDIDLKIYENLLLENNCNIR